jgi:SAM-dependent methyltransferase
LSDASRHDAWQAADGYDAYIGRWSRLIAPQFLDLLGVHERLDWLEVGCGTGALSAEIIQRCAPKSLIGIDPSKNFLAKARETVTDERAEFRQGDAQALDLPAASRDVVVSALVLNFVPDRAKALGEMKRVARPGGTIAFYVWDYPGGGLEFLRAFWTEVQKLDAGVGHLTEGRRFPFCTPDMLAAMAEAAGLAHVRCRAITAPTVFADFEDFWRPFTLGAGPAPGYVASLADEQRKKLRDVLKANLPIAEDGSIKMKARAWAVIGTA